MEKTSEDKIRERAHQLWREAGEPKEGEQDFWLKAEKEMKEGEGKPDDKGDAPSSEER